MNVRAAATSAVAFAATGCHGCRDSHPYVPYAVESRLTPAVSSDGGAPRAPRGEPNHPHRPFDGLPATVAPPGQARWTMAAIALQAPEGRMFVSALVGDFDADGIADAFAIVRAVDGSDPGELAYYRGQGSGGWTMPTWRVPPPDLAMDPACSPVHRLMGVGDRAVLVELGARCSNARAVAPDRWVALVRAGPEADVRFAATLGDPPGAGILSVDGDSADRDGDGREDVAIRVTLDGAGPPSEAAVPVSADFAWLDRRAGLSRDVGVTESSFASAAAGALARARRSKDALRVPAFVARTRSLWRAVCAESASPRIAVAGGGTGAMTCSLGRSLDELGIAEVRAYVTAGDPFRAALALDRAERWSSARSGSRFGEAQRWIAQAAPWAGARLVRSVAAVPWVMGREPAWGPLAFEPSGKLLVHTRVGIVRVDPDTGDEAAADGAADWKSAVTSRDGAMRWTDTYDPCDGIALRATFLPTGAGEAHDVALTGIPIPVARCSGSRGLPPRALAVASGPMGIEALVEGEPVLISPDVERSSPLASFLDQKATPGGPRSPDGTVVVVSWVHGLVERAGGARTRMLRAQELDGSYGDQRDCTVSSDATHVACILGGKAWVGTWDAF